MSFQTIGAKFGVAITPNDSTILAPETRGFQVEAAGNVALGYPDGRTCVWPACAEGIIHPHFGFNRVLATGTTATGIVVAY